MEKSDLRQPGLFIYGFGGLKVCFLNRLWTSCKLCRQQEETTYLIEGRLGALEGHIPQEQVIVVFEPNACAKVVIVLHV